jgi:hypothetical protein
MLDFNPKLERWVEAAELKKWIKNKKTYDGLFLDLANKLIF